ncbi:MAG: P-II family nitrogen regulator [Planctomycetota bacterium]|nr:P-II family nitrogen regulator [Planctomycetota bacterium]
MKLVIAYIRPDKLQAVKEALFAQEVFKISVEDAFGCGELPPKGQNLPTQYGFEKQIRLEIAVNEPFVRRTIDAIIRGARTGKVGDGKIFVVDLCACYRIRNDDTGMEAIG